MDDWKLYNGIDKKWSLVLRFCFQLEYRNDCRKTATSAKTKVNIVKAVCLEASDPKVNKSLKEGEGYNYVEIFDADKFSAKVMKVKLPLHNFR